MKTKRNLVIGLSGPIAAGKSTLAHELNELYGFEIINTRDFIAKFIEMNNEVVDDTKLQDYGNKIMSGEDANNFCKLILDSMSSHKNYVIDSIRPISHFNFFKMNLKEFCTIFITAPNDLRKQRFLERKGNRDNSAESFIKRNSHDVESEVQSLLLKSDIIINNQSKESIRNAINHQIYPLFYSTDIYYFQQIIDLVIQFHLKHSFAVGTGSLNDISYLVGLMVEELGEIHECISKNIGDIIEEQADLLYLLIGGSITLGKDLENAIINKHIINMNRPRKLNN